MTKTCMRCGAEWNARVEHPRYCPICKSPMWNMPRQFAGMARTAMVSAPAGAKGIDIHSMGISMGTVTLPRKKTESAPVPLGYHNTGRRPKKTKACPSCGGINGLHQKGCEK